MNEPLPEVHEAVLDEETLARLLADLAEHAEVLDIWTKGAPTAHASGAALSLSEIGPLLGSGAVRGVQIRYRFEGGEWRDTLLRGPGGVRLLRMRTPH